MECAASHLRGPCAGPATLRCGACGALRYCSRAHQKAHWSEHAAACTRLHLQMQRAPELFDLPFTFSPDSALCSLLHSWNLHGNGLWTSLCSCFEPSQQNSQNSWHLPPLSCPCKPPSLPSTPSLPSQAYLPSQASQPCHPCQASQPCESSPPSPSSLASLASHPSHTSHTSHKSLPPPSLLSWEDYYKWRGLPFDSPVALLLHFPLSLYHALVGFGAAPASSSLVVHYVGPERELDLLPVFAEVLALLPWRQIHIDFIGPAVPEARDGETSTFSSFPPCGDDLCGCKDVVVEGSLTTRLWRGFYHDRCGEMERPDLVFGANAGIPAYPSWKRTMEVIGVPALFTDYCEEAAVMAAEMIASVRGCDLEVPVQVNPFRQPVSCKNTDLDVPTFSNGFMFGFQGHLNGT